MPEGRWSNMLRGYSKGTVMRVFHPLKYKPYLLSHGSAILQDIKRMRVKDVDVHLQAAMNWLRVAQDVTGDGGVSAGYSFKDGWLSSYPETTGYIIPTFFEYYRYSGEKDYYHRAVRMAEWEVVIQLGNGAFQSGLIGVHSEPNVFVTGQVMLGLIRAFRETGDEIYLNSARRAGDWLVKIQDDDGAWRVFTYNKMPHTYHSRVSWALLQLYRTTEEKCYKRAAERNIEWLLSNRLENGWFRNSTIRKGEKPSTHPIAYTIRGLIECGLLLGIDRMVKVAVESSRILMENFESKGFLPSTWDENWKSKDKRTHLPGDAQMSIIWFKVYSITKDLSFLNAAIKMNEFLKSTQDLRSRNRGIRGGIKASYPIWRGSFFYPNWAAKFFVDALLLERELGNA